MYDLIDFARGRLINTVIKIGGVPCLVLNIGVERSILYKNLITQKQAVIHLDSADIDLTPLQLGYANFKQGASYIIRLAQRRWKQGIDRGGIIIRGPDHRDQDYFKSAEMVDCFRGAYPSLEEAIIRSSLEGKTIAFHRKWAVSPKGNLFYRGKSVGYCKDGLHLKDVYKYLKELLEESL